MDDIHYGVLNAFDDGDNWHNGINYTYRLTSRGSGEWIEVHFMRPVTVRSVEKDGCVNSEILAAGNACGAFLLSS